MAKSLPMPRSAADRTLVIAELSANHGGELALALETLHAAKEAGADAVKLQTYTAETMTLDSDAPWFRIESGPWAGRTFFELYQEAHTPWDWHARLFEKAADLDLPIFSSPFDGTAVDLLEELDAPAYKVASFELTDLELLDRIAATGKPVIASTGMATLAEIERGVVRLRARWESDGREAPSLVLLKCVSAYPAPAREMNLATIPHLAEAFGVVAGLSDHTLTDAAAIAAVALGARVLEKHFILARSQGGPDSHFSIEPKELEQLVKSVRDAEAAVGVVRYGPTEADAGNRRFRRSIFATTDVAAGDIITRSNVRVIRPGDGLAPEMLPVVLGRKAAAAIPRGTPITWELLG